ncbi:hypothetical protein [Kitasatospora cheerisanensis]|uniref:Gram-positive cocci surface proteins LPxTG domain-containing protein n=1 Tax=Kitasatospora cheerisanensis KCTC 2395 TaxID=1348663 RepID=A0A066YY85_9ACTN|nr:hypothetical protein [Kitasatospora cheerisanensis]KDN84959.1 hypothetical protein KCH_34860 [Kitasatospora cheerisanensis KCTC 2395]
MGNSRITRPAAIGAPLAAAVLALSSAPAHAAEELRLDVPATFAVPAAPASGDATAMELQVTSSGPLAADTSRDVVVTYDATGLAGIASFTPPATGWGSKCTATGQVHTCTFGVRSWPNSNSFSSQFNPKLTAVKGAPQGQAGHLKISQNWAGSPAGAATDVSVYAGGPKLEFDQGIDSRPIEAGQPGSVVKQAFQVTNNGTVESGQLVVGARLSPGLTFKQHYANCSYGTYTGTFEPFKNTQAAVCTVNTSVKPGQTVTLDPIEAVVGTDALYPDIEFTVASGENSPSLKYVRGDFAFAPASQSGPRLTAGLPEDPNAKPGPPNVGPQAREHVILQYRITNHADFSARGAWAPTDGGKKGTLTLTVHNGGPAAVEYLRSGNPIATVLATLPSGVTVSGKLPDGCFTRPEHPDLVACNLPMWLLNGADLSFALPLAVSDPAAAPKAAVALTTEQGAYEVKVEALPYDTENANNAFSLALGSTAATAAPSATPGPTGTPTGAPSGAPSGSPAATGPARPSGSATPSVSASSSATAQGGSGGGLAFTGSEGTGTMVGLGIGAIVLGGGVIALVARRRRGEHS